MTWVKKKSSVSGDTVIDATLENKHIKDGTIAIAKLSDVKDEDDMASNSATHLATQQSIKAYVDANAGGGGDVVDDTSPQLGGNLDLNGNNITGTGQIQLASGSASAPTIRFANSSNTGIYSDGAGIFNISTGGTERLEINASGEIGIAGAPVSGKKLNVGGVLAGTTFQMGSYNTITGAGANYNAGLTFTSFSSASTPYKMIEFKLLNGTSRGNISIGFYSTYYNTSSDYRLKENLQDVHDATAKVLSLKPCSFNWIGADHRVDGFLAHELAEVIPDAVTGVKDGVDDDGNPEYQSIDQSKLVPLLVKTIQELEARITALENE
nr:hypothetical protein [uncultured Mediterranean phage uvMED]